MKKGLLELEGLHFHARHGCLPEEREAGNHFRVDFSAVYDMTAAAESDDLADAVDYGGVYEVIAAQMAQPSNLLEHVAARILAAVQAAYPELEQLRVRVAKKNPPVGGSCDWSAVTLEA